jgi:prepilin-type N-terminal cleavage/methylation domain-containing protein
MTAQLRRSRRDQGFTLVEVLVAMTILSIVMALTTGLVIRALDQNSNAGQQSQAQQRNNVGMEALTRALRQAVLPTNGTNKNSSIISVAQPTQIQFTTRLQGTSAAQAGCASGTCPWATTPVQVLAQLNTTTHNLQWGTASQPASCATPCVYPTPTLTRTLVYGVRNNLGATACPRNSGTAIFHYWYVDATGNLAAWSAAIPTAPTQAELAKISVVQIDLYTQTQTGPQKPGCVALSDYVQLRNWS